MPTSMGRLQGGIEGQPQEQPLTPTVLFSLVAGFWVLALGALLAPAVTWDMDALWSQVNLDNPYLSGLAPALLYMRMPAAVVGTFALFLLPGCTLAWAFDRGRSWTRLASTGFGISLLVVSAFATLVQSLSDAPVLGAPFIAAMYGLGAVCTAVLGLRVRAGLRPAMDTRPGMALVGLAAMPVLLIIVLTPKLFWESSNGDGTQMLEVSRYLLRQPVPFVPKSAGVFAGWPGVNGMLNAYVLSVFVRFFGEHMAAVRVPFVLFLTILYAIVVEVGQQGRPRFNRVGHGLALASVLCFGAVNAYSAAYDPYSSDLALPATQDTLMIALFLYCVRGFLRADVPAFFYYTLLSLLCSPGGLVLLGLLFVATWLASRELDWRGFARMAGALVGAFVVYKAVGPLVSALGLPTPGGEHDPGNYLGRFGMLAPFDVRRFLFVIVPCGIYPMWGFLTFKRTDDGTRALLLVTLGSFFLFYPLAKVHLHYFVPAMVLPVVAFLRHFGGARLPVPGRAAAFACAAVALFLTMPVSSGIYSSTREIGSKIDVSRASGYAESEGRVFTLTNPIKELFLSEAGTGVPEEFWGGSPLPMRHYAELAGSKGHKNYAITDPDVPPPPGMRLVAEHENGRIYVRDETEWRADQRHRARSSLGRKMFLIPRNSLFMRLGVEKELKLFSVPNELEKRPFVVWTALALVLLTGPVAVFFFRRWARS